MPPKMQRPVTPEWLKAHKSMNDALKNLTKHVQNLDKYYTGKVMARKVQESQNGPYKKLYSKLRTDTNMVHKALEANKTDRNQDEVKTFQKLIDNMFSDDLGHVGDTHAGITHPDEANRYCKAALKKWNAEAKKLKNRTVKKIINQSKAPVMLEELSKFLMEINKANGMFGQSRGYFQQSYLHFRNGLKEVNEEMKKLAAQMKKTKATAKEMDEVTM